MQHYCPSTLRVLLGWAALLAAQVLHGQEPAQQKQTCTKDAVVAEALAEPIPETKLDEFLWDRFSKTSVLAAHYDLNTLEWEEQSKDYAAELVRKAKDAKLDAASLERLLAKEAPVVGNRAHAPVAAYAVTIKGKPAWIILSRWGYSDKGKPPKVTKTKGMPKIEFPCQDLGHVQIGAFDAETFKCLGFNTCM